jgi:hypothetical protein
MKTTQKNYKIESAIKLLEQNGYKITNPKEPEETEYRKAIRTGVIPEIWPPIMMTQDDLQHFSHTHGITK